MPFAPEAKESLERALQQSLRLGHSFIGTEHLLLGVLQMSEVGESARVLHQLGAAPELLADAVLSQLEGGTSDPVKGRRAAAIPEAQLAEHAVPVLPSRDLQRTLTFYERLGFALRGATIETYEYLIVMRGTIELHFYLDRDVDPLTTSFSCYVRVRDADRLHLEWDTIGVPTDAATGSRLMAPADTAYGLREFALVDPDGNLLRVGSLAR
jgi:catechol 2,3-dioxygenase-like lactoylglutathione lyase family enzyme